MVGTCNSSLQFVAAPATRQTGLLSAIPALLLHTGAVTFPRGATMNPQNKLALEGKKFGHLTVICRSTKPGHWDCVCDCGEKRSIRSPMLTKGRQNSCGCQRGKYFKKPAVWKKCEICGDPFSVQPYRAETAKCCSVRCRQSRAGRIAGIAIAKRLRGTGRADVYVKRNGRHEHRVVMEEMLGRRLGPEEIVHHKDGNPHNNNLDNLELTTRAKHPSFHKEDMRQEHTVKELDCTWVGCTRKQRCGGYCSLHYQKLWRLQKKKS